MKITKLRWKPFSTFLRALLPRYPKSGKFAFVVSQVESEAARDSELFRLSTLDTKHLRVHSHPVPNIHRRFPGTNSPSLATASNHVPRTCHASTSQRFHSPYANTSSRHISIHIPYTLHIFAVCFSHSIQKIASAVPCPLGPFARPPVSLMQASSIPKSPRSMPQLRHHALCARARDHLQSPRTRMIE